MFPDLRIVKPNNVEYLVKYLRGRVEIYRYVGKPSKLMKIYNIKQIGQVPVCITELLEVGIGRHFRYGLRDRFKYDPKISYLLYDINYCLCSNIS